uniref:Uncharacterized protein n=1 Tax=viral metagenome TaxID=1070528 RepID=A0A6M3LVR6_9ZZZZ
MKRTVLILILLCMAGNAWGYADPGVDPSKDRKPPDWVPPPEEVEQDNTDYGTGWDLFWWIRLRTEPGIADIERAILLYLLTMPLLIP